MIVLPSPRWTSWYGDLKAAETTSRGQLAVAVGGALIMESCDPRRSLHAREPRMGALYSPFLVPEADICYPALLQPAADTTDPVASDRYNRVQRPVDLANLGMD